MRQILCDGTYMICCSYKKRENHFLSNYSFPDLILWAYRLYFVVVMQTYIRAVNHVHNAEGPDQYRQASTALLPTADDQLFNYIINL